MNRKHNSDGERDLAKIRQLAEERRDDNRRKNADWNQRNWMTWLQDNLSFPFMTERVEDDDDAYFNPAAALKLFTLGHKMKVLAIVNEDDLYGIIVKVREGKKVGYVPLCDLKVISQADKTLP